jgi:hypothetical protein
MYLITPICLYLWTLFLDFFFLIPWNTSLLPNSTYIFIIHIWPTLSHMGFLIGCVFSNGVMINDWRCRDETESLLWVHTQGCAAWHALVSQFLIMIHCRATPMCYLLAILSWSIPQCLVRRSIYQIKSSRTSSWSCIEDNLWRTGHRHKH